jgi:hemoglobin
VGLEAEISDKPQYGVGDASYQAAGGEVGIRKLVDDFYDVMEQRPEAQKIRKMHPADLTVSRDKLTLFLCGWLGGPRSYST